MGELLALSPADIDIPKNVIHITKSYQRFKGKDVITDLKTPKSKRDVVIPDFLCDELQDYMSRLYGITKKDRLFHITKTYLHHEMDRGAKKAWMLRIRIHDLRQFVYEKVKEFQKAYKSSLIKNRLKSLLQMLVDGITPELYSLLSVGSKAKYFEFDIADNNYNLNLYKEVMGKMNKKCLAQNCLRGITVIYEAKMMNRADGIQEKKWDRGR